MFEPLMGSAWDLLWMIQQIEDKWIRSEQTGLEGTLSRHAGLRAWIMWFSINWKIEKKNPFSSENNEICINSTHPRPLCQCLLVGGVVLGGLPMAFFCVIPSQDRELSTVDWRHHFISCPANIGHVLKSYWLSEVGETQGNSGALTCWNEV